MNDNERNKILDKELESMKKLTEEFERSRKFYEESVEFCRRSMNRMIGWGTAFIAFVANWYLLHSYNEELALQLKYPLLVALGFCMYMSVRKVRIYE